MNMNRVNLIPIPRRQAAERRRCAKRWAWIIGGYTLVLLAGFAACETAINAQSDESSAALDKVIRQIEELNHTGTALHPQLAEVQTRLIVARTVGDQPDWSLLLSLISTCVDNDIVLTISKMETAAPPATKPSKDNKNAPPPMFVTISLQGVAKSQAAMTQFVLRLERLGLFERVDLLNSSRQAFGDSEADGFRIECLLRRSPKPIVKKPIMTKPTGGKTS